MITLGIIGKGFVGSRLIQKYTPVCKVISYDIKDGISYPKEQIKSCDLVMICVNTPPLDDGTVDIRNVEAAIKKTPNQNIVVRSTVPPGTTEYFRLKYKKNICFCPEYVGESHFLSSDWNNFERSNPFIILGGEKKGTMYFRDIFEEIHGPNLCIMEMESAEAELVKYMENSYFALKVAFVNEYRNLAEHIGVNWNSVREGWLLDPRIERDHTSAFANKPGFDGKCLPKDVSGIINFASMNGYEMSIMKAINRFNKKIGFLRIY